MMNSWYIIANPTSGNKKLSRKWEEIKKILHQKNIDFSYVFTEYAKHEVELVHKAIQQGFRNIISVGGDGTLHNVVNGVMTQSYTNSSNINIGVIPLGTGNDWIKNYDIPNDIKKSIDILLNKKTILQDIGFLELEETSAYFNNIAGLGFDGYVIERLNKYKNLGAIGYLISAILAISKYNPIEFTIKTDTETIKTRSLMTLFGIGEYSSGGMKLIDYKSTVDGLFSVTIVKDFNLGNIIANVKKLFNGRIFNHKKVTVLSSSTITVTPSKKAYIQADGELIGIGKVTASIIEKAINFIIA